VCCQWVGMEHYDGFVCFVLFCFYLVLYFFSINHFCGRNIRHTGILYWSSWMTHWTWYPTAMLDWQEKMFNLPTSPTQCFKTWIMLLSYNVWILWSEILRCCFQMKALQQLTIFSVTQYSVKKEIGGLCPVPNLRVLDSEIQLSMQWRWLRAKLRISDHLFPVAYWNCNRKMFNLFC